MLLWFWLLCLVAMTERMSKSLRRPTRYGFSPFPSSYQNADPFWSVQAEVLAPSDPDNVNQPAPFLYITENVYVTERCIARSGQAALGCLISLHSNLCRNTTRDRKRSKRMICGCQFDPGKSSKLQGGLHYACMYMHSCRDRQPWRCMWRQLPQQSTDDGMVCDCTKFIPQPCNPLYVTFFNFLAGVLAVVPDVPQASIAGIGDFKRY